MATIHNGRFECATCNKDTKVAPHNAVVYYYHRQPWFSYLEFICNQCQAINHAFFGPNDHETYIFDLAITTDIGFITKDFAEPNVSRSYAKVYGLKLLQRRKLNQQDHKLLIFFRWLLNRGVMS